MLSKALGSDELVDALERIRDGEVLTVGGPEDAESAGAWPAQAIGLTEREAEIIALITQACATRRSPTVVPEHQHGEVLHPRAYRKMGVTSRSQAVLWAVDHGLG